MQCPVQDRKRNQKNPNLLCFVVWLAFVCVQFASLAKRLIACSNLTRFISYLTGFSFSTPSPSYYYHHHHHPTILVMWAFRFELYGSLVTHLGNFFFWIIFFRVFFLGMLIYSPAYCTVVLVFFFLSVWYVFLFWFTRWSIFVCTFSLSGRGGSFLMDNMFPRIDCLPLCGYRGENGYTYMTSKYLPSKTLQAPCMVCACILTL